MKTYNSKERIEIVRQLRSLGKKYDEIAKMVGVTKQRIHQICTGYKSVSIKYSNDLAKKTLQGKSVDEIREYLSSIAKENGKVNPIVSVLMFENITKLTGMKHGSRERFREVIRIRDNSTCQCCKKRWVPGSRRFDIHHIYGSGGESRLCGGNPDELITLCHRCHLQIDSWKIEKKLSVAH